MNHDTDALTTPSSRGLGISQQSLSDSAGDERRSSRLDHGKSEKVDHKTCQRRTPRSRMESRLEQKRAIRAARLSNILAATPSELQSAIHILPDHMVAVLEDRIHQILQATQQPNFSKPPKWQDPETMESSNSSKGIASVDARHSDQISTQAFRPHSRELPPINVDLTPQNMINIRNTMAARKSAYRRARSMKSGPGSIKESAGADIDG